MGQPIINPTRAERPGEELPRTNLLSFLHAAGLVANGNGEIEVLQYSNGYSNLTYLLKVEDKDYVLRRPPFSAPKRGHDMGREYKVLRQLNPIFKKAPRVFAFCDDTNVIGAPFYIMEKVSGEILTAKAALQREVSPAAFKTIANTWLDTFVAFHNIDYADANLADLGRPEGYVARQVSNWGKQYLAAKTNEVPSSQKVMAWMEEHQPTSYDHTLIHNDFKYDNVVFKDGNWIEISAILDWEMCTLGDPLMDLGTSLGYWITLEEQEFAKMGIPSPTMMPGNPSRSEIVHQYALKSGKSINNIVFYYVFGLFKIAVIAQQIYYRYHNGHTTDPKFSQLNKTAALLCNRAWQAIQKKSIDTI